MDEGKETREGIFELVKVRDQRFRGCRCEPWTVRDGQEERSQLGRANAERVRVRPRTAHRTYRADVGPRVIASAGVFTRLSSAPRLSTLRLVARSPSLWPASGGGMTTSAASVVGYWE